MNKKKITSALITSVLTIALAGQTLAAPIEYGEELKNAPQSTPYVSFTDLPLTHWAYNYIANMVQKKVLEGYVDNKFRPENIITRAEFATIIVKASGIKPTKINYASFSDVPVTNWASPFVESVKDYMTGYRLANGQYNFNPDTPATREDITVAIVKLKGYDTRLANRAAVEPIFKDFDSISESAKDYVAIAVKEGLVSGYPDETFRGQATITRAEASALLYRSFLYGNDNKGVGEQSNSTTPTASSTQTPTTPTTTSSTTQPQPSSQSVKFSVETLAGGVGVGDVDGPVSIAKINAVDSMVTDKDGNIYFLDKGKKKVRRFNSANGTIETITTIDSAFNWGNSVNGTVTNFLHSNMSPIKLAYNAANNSVYLGVSYQKSPDFVELIYKLTPSVQMAVYGMNNASDLFDFIQFNNQDIIFSVSGSQGWDEPYAATIFNGQMQNHEATAIASSTDKTWIPYNVARFQIPIVDALALDNEVYVFTANNGTVSKIQLFPRKLSTIVTQSNITFESVTTNNGKFYASSGITIYELTTDGKLTPFIDGKDLTYIDGNPITRISQMNFDSQGNIIIYDEENKAIRRINL